MRLIFESFYENNETFNKIAFYMSIFINAGYFFEALTKIISFGVYFNKNAYFRQYLNIFDFFILIIAILELSFWNNKRFLNDLKVNYYLNSYFILIIGNYNWKIT